MNKKGLIAKISIKYVLPTYIWISGGFRTILRDFAEIPEFRGSATARNIRSPVLLKLILKKVKFLSMSMFRWRFLKKILNVCFFWDEILLAGSAILLFNSYK